jgi:hypothetical protein
MEDEKKEGQGSGKSPTKFVERPEERQRKKKKEQETPGSDDPGFSSDDLDALENQEKEGDSEDSTINEGWNKKPEAPKGDQKADPRKSQEPEKRDSSSDDAGDCACP